MIEMQKRIAMAIQETAHKLAIERDGSSAVRLSDEEALRLARSCLLVMREPTEAMLKPGGDALAHFEAHRNDNAAAIWRAMVDVALKG